MLHCDSDSTPFSVPRSVFFNLLDLYAPSHSYSLIIQLIICTMYKEFQSISLRYIGLGSIFKASKLFASEAYFSDELCTYGFLLLMGL